MILLVQFTMTRIRGRKRKRILSLRAYISRRNIESLLSQALKEGIRGNICLAEELGQIARKLGKITGVKIPKIYKYFYCKQCKSLIIPGKTMVVRLRTNRTSHIVIRCLKCGYIKRIPIKSRGR